MDDPTADQEELSLPQFLEQLHDLHDQTGAELREIEVLVKQSSAEVERLMQRNARVTNYVSQLQTNFDTIPREDIKEGYEALINAQQRLFTMRGQLEKLQSDQRNLQRLSDLQRQTLEMTAGMEGAPRGRSRAARDQFSIIRVIQSEEAARQSLVRRMHDGPASSLSNFILQAEICQRFFDFDPERARAELNDLKSSAANTFRAVKNFIFDLRPMMLDDLGVVPTLRRYAENFEEKYNLPVTLNVTGQARRLEEHVEVTIFRAVQELLNNARSHGQATAIEVLIDLDPNEVLLVISDNGSGFDPDLLEENTGRGAIGLSMLRERIEMLGGQLRVDSTLGDGARAEFTIPVEMGVEELLVT
ncbi:MAG: sensor histidine kinase [Candidatus Promineifilaceae bacterium]